MRILLLVSILTAFAGSALACPADQYQNSEGHCVYRPTPPTTTLPPSIPSTRCNDGSYSHSEHRSGTCSHHGGIAH
jgi:hypothetical protein